MRTVKSFLTALAVLQFGIKPQANSEAIYSDINLAHRLGVGSTDFLVGSEASTSHMVSLPKLEVADTCHYGLFSEHNSNRTYAETVLKLATSELSPT